MFMSCQHVGFLNGVKVAYFIMGPVGRLGAWQLLLDHCYVEPGADKESETGSHF